MRIETRFEDYWSNSN